MRHDVFVRYITSDNIPAITKLIHNGWNIHKGDGYYLQYASLIGRDVIVKILVINGAMITDSSITNAYINGYLDIGAFLKGTRLEKQRERKLNNLLK
jgi:hypothetical protein